MGPELVEFLKMFGFPTAFAVAIGFAFWSVLKWIAAKMIEPGMIHLQEVTVTMSQIRESMGEQTEINKGILISMQEKAKFMGLLEQRLERIEKIVVK